MGHFLRATVFVALSGAAACAEMRNTILPADDAYHLKYWSDTPALATFTEWWYFNLLDTAQDLQAVLVYAISNPDQAGSAAGAATTIAVAYTPGGVTNKADMYPVSEFSAAYNLADVQLGGNAIQVSGGAYQLTGASQDGAIAWNLTFNREAPSFQGLNLAEVGKQPWEKMSWLVYMPRAGVTGQLTVNGTDYVINGSGYHDHNWGEWTESDVLWNWAQYSQNGFWFDIYDFIGESNGTAHVEVNGTTFEFTKSQYQLIHNQWAYDPVNHVNYPIETTFQADNGTDQLDAVIDVDQFAVLGGESSYPAPAYLIYEQTATCSGQVVANGVPVQFRGQGFQEYTVDRP